MKKAPSRGRSHAGLASSKKPMAEHCCSMQSARWTFGLQSKTALALSRRKKSTVWVARPPSRSISGSLPRQTAIFRNPFAKAASGKTSSTASTSSTSPLPALRDRPADIVALAEHFAKKYAAVNGLEGKPISLEARRHLAKHRWAGNVRELENTIHRAVLLAMGPEIDVDAIRLPDGTRLDASPAPVDGLAAQAAATADAVSRNYVGQTVAGGRARTDPQYARPLHR